MKKLAIASALLLVLVAAGLFVLLNTGAGLRWAVDRALAFSGAPVEIESLEGRLLGPVSVTGVDYRDPDSGTRVRVDALQLDWRPGALLRGVLHVTRLRTAGVEYTAGTPGEDAQTEIAVPDLSLPVAVRVDQLELESFAIDDGATAATVVESASLRGSLDDAALALEDIRITAPRFVVSNGRIRLELSPNLPVTGRLEWRAEPAGMPAVAGAFEVGGALRQAVEPSVELIEPFTARADGSVNGLFDTLSWTVNAEVPETVALNSIVSNWPALSVRGRVQASGDTGHARLQPDAFLAFQDLAGTLNGDMTVSKDELVVDRARFEREHGQGTVDFSGRVAFADPLQWSLDAAVPDPVALNSIEPAWPALSVQGRIQGSGDAARARLRPDVSLAFQSKTATLTGDVEVSKEALVINRARLERRDDAGAVDFSGRLAFSTPLQWSLDADITEAVALSSIEPAWPALSVAGRIRSQGDTTQASLSPDVTLSYQDIVANLTSELAVSRDELVVSEARLERKDADDAVDFSGRLGFTEVLPFTVRADWQSLNGPDAAAWSSRRGELAAEGDLDALTASVSGTVRSPDQDEESPVTLELEASGLRAEPAVTGTAHLPYFAWGGTAVTELNADVDLRSAGRADSRVVVTASEIALGGRQVTGLDLRVNGTPERHRATLEGRLDDWSITVAVAGSYAEDRWQGTVNRLDAASEQEPLGGPWNLEQPANVAWSPSKTEVGRLCLRHDAASLCAGGHFARSSDWDLSASIDALPLSWLAVNAPEPMQIDGAVTAEVNVGAGDAGIEGNAEARIDRASVDWQGEDPIRTTYQDVVLTAALTDDELNLKLDGKVDENGTIQGELTTADPLAEDGAIRGSLAIDLPSLRVVQAAVPALGLQKGTARLRLEIDGTRSAPRFGGEARVEDATIEIAVLGTRLTSLRLDISNADPRRLVLDARADAGDGTLSADGFVEWPAGGGWRGEINVQGDEAELARLPVALVAGSPDLKINVDQSGGTVGGRLVITRARLTPEAGRPRITISSDIVIKGDEESQQATRNPMAWHADVTVELGDDVTLTGYGVKGRLSGSLELNAPPGQPTRANGSIEINDGQYSLYGRDFEIRKGRLVYTGGPIDNPGVEVQIGRDTGEVTVTLSLTGPLHDPALDLSANQSMSETDMMSYLLLGRPASQASEAETGLLLRAAASLIPGGGGGGVQNYVQSTLGLDTLAVRADSPESESEGASVELGKYLSPKLYVSYVAGFQEAVDVFRVRYELARHWLLRAESSTRESGGDLLFTW